MCNATSESPQDLKGLVYKVNELDTFRFPNKYELLGKYFHILVLKYKVYWCKVHFPESRTAVSHCVDESLLSTN